MPRFDFRCGSCGHTFERKLPSSSSPKPKCPLCRNGVKRLFTAPAAAMTRSTPGFFNTDSR